MHFLARCLASVPRFPVPYECREVQCRQPVLGSVHQSQGLLGCDHWLKHGTGPHNTMHAALYGMEYQTCDSAEDNGFWTLCSRRLVSPLRGYFRKITVVDHALQGLCRQPDAYDYHRPGQRWRSDL